MSAPAGENARITFDPGNIEIDVRPGQSLLEAARELGLQISSVCGGRGTCGKCRVLIRGPVDDPDAVERLHLSQPDLDRGVRLACRTQSRPGQAVKPLRAEGGRARILKGGKGRPVVPSPNVRKLCVALPDAGSDDSADWDRVARALGDERVDLGLSPLRQLPSALKASPREITLALHGGRLASVEAGNTSQHQYGIAFDIGTTTVVGYLLDLTNGRELAVASGLNPQGAYGSDVISRLSFVQERDDGLSILQQEIVFLMNRLIHEMVEGSGIDPRHIYEVTAVGNVVMHHLLLGLDPSAMARAPYAPVILDALDFPAADLGLHLGRQAEVHVLPNIAGFVGADMVGALLTTLPHLSPVIQLVIDLGTNGEIALGSRDRLLVCSTAAGPAFEGACIRHGMRAAGGAIDRVRIDTDVHCHVIDGGPPSGICGSGLVDAIAGLLDNGVVTPSGRLLGATQLKPDTSARLRARIRGAGQPGDELRFVLSNPGGSHDRPEVAITQQDIRELQMAKGAVSAGIQVLKKELGIDDEDIDQVILAGAFGTFVSAESARRIGLIPPLPLSRVKAIGNAAGFGAQLALLSTVERGIAGLIARQSEHVRLSGRTDFQSLFIQALQFPPG